MTHFWQVQSHVKNGADIVSVETVLSYISFKWYFEIAFEIHLYSQLNPSHVLFISLVFCVTD